MNDCCRHKPPLPGGRTTRATAGRDGLPAPSPGTRREQERSGRGVLRLRLAPLACCSGPLLIAGLAAAGALAWGAIALAAVLLLAGAVLVIWRRRRACCRAAELASPQAGTAADPRVAPR